MLQPTTKSEPKVVGGKWKVTATPTPPGGNADRCDVARDVRHKFPIPTSIWASRF